MGDDRPDSGDAASENQSHIKRDQPTATTEPWDVLGDGMLALEKRLGRLTTWLIILVVVLVAFGVTSIVALESYVPTVQVVATHASPTSPIATTSLPPVTLGVRPASGPGAGGNEVAITGVHLEKASSVHFGSLSAAIIGVNATGTGIVALAPPHAAGTVDVTVRTPRGTSPVSSDDQYIYLAPTVIGVTPKSGVGGTSVTITGSDLTGVTGVMFGGLPATSFSVLPAAYLRPARIVAVAPSGEAEASTSPSQLRVGSVRPVRRTCSPTPEP